jgi:hypothetical protein
VVASVGVVLVLLFEYPSWRLRCCSYQEKRAWKDGERDWVACVMPANTDPEAKPQTRSGCSDHDPSSFGSLHKV